jgi:ubiquinone/menaquinone biosynthesis C-methylase UbiE
VPDPEGALDEFLRVVRPGGMIVLANHFGQDSGTIVHHLEALDVGKAAPRHLAVRAAEHVLRQVDAVDLITLVPDPEGALDEFLRVVRPGGMIVLANHFGQDRSRGDRRPSPGGP